MSRDMFMLELAAGLRHLPEARRAEIYEDIARHFEEGVAEGVSEDALASMLGDPRALAREYAAIQAADIAKDQPSFRNVTRAVASAVGMGMLTIILVLPLWLAALGVWIALVAASVSMVVSGLAAAVCSLIDRVRPLSFVYFPQTWPAFFGGLAALSLGLMCVIGVAALGRRLAGWTAAYVQINAKVLSGRRDAR